MNDLRYRLDRAIYISERLEESLGVTGGHARIEYAWVSEQDLSEEQRRWHDTHTEMKTLGQLVLAIEDERIPEGWDLADYTDEIGEMYRRENDAD